MRPPSFLSCVLLSLALAAAYVAMAAHEAGRISPPLDDAFIHLQYATRLAEGHPWSYMPGESCTSGATSTLWPVLLAGGALLGLQGTGLYLWGVGIGAFSLAIAAWYSAAWVRRAGYPTVAAWVGWGVLLCGPLQWGTFSGMEIGVFAAAASALLYHANSAGPLAWGWSLVLSLIRPEGWLMAGFWALERSYHAKKEGRLLQTWPLWLSVVPGVLPFLVSYVCSGSLLSTSVMAKQNPRFTQPSEISQLWFLVDELLFGAFGERYFGRGGVLVVGVMAIGAYSFLRTEWSERRLGYGLRAFVFFCIPLITNARMVGMTFHHSRYLMPVLPIFVAFLLIGTDRLRQQFSTGWAVSGLALAWLGVGSAGWMNQFAKNASDIGLQQVALSEWIRHHTPETARLAVNDAGAIPHLSGRSIIDLEGIVSPDTLRWALAGEGSVFSLLVREKPDFLVIFPVWFPTMSESGLFQVVARASLDKRTISGGTEMDVILLNPELLKSGAQWPALNAQEQVVDTVDVSDLDSEAAHAYQIEAMAPLAGRRNVVVSAKEEARIVVDGARRLEDPESFQLHTQPGNARLMVRLGPSSISTEALLVLNGAVLGPIRFPAVAEGQWVDVAWPLTPSNGGDIEITIIPTDELGGMKGGRLVGRWWLVQEKKE